MPIVERAGAMFPNAGTTFFEIFDVVRRIWTALKERLAEPAPAPVPVPIRADRR